MIGSDIITFLLSLAFIAGSGIGAVIGYGLGKAETIVGNYNKEKERE